MLIVLTTVPTTESGEALATKLVDEKLAACVQVMPRMTSVYRWNNELQVEGEHLVLIKTLDEKWDEIRLFIEQNNSYDVPEIFAIDSEHVSGPYLNWMKGLLR